MKQIVSISVTQNIHNCTDVRGEFVDNYQPEDTDNAITNIHDGNFFLFLLSFEKVFVEW